MNATEIIFDDSTPTSVTHDPRFKRGMVARNYAKHPVEMFAAMPTAAIPVIDPSEYDDRIAEQEKEESSLEHVWNRSGVLCLSQNGFGYCWAHSTTQGVMMARLRDNEPHVALSAVGMAAIIKKGADEGGWCGESAAFARDSGIPLASAYPQDLGTEKLNDGRHQGQIDSILRSSYLKFGNLPDVSTSEKFNRITVDFTDLSRGVYDQNMKMSQFYSCLLLNIPCPIDLNWWGHSVLAARMIGSRAKGYSIRILNSWWEAPNKPWGQNGFATLSGQKAVPDQALGIVAVTATQLI